MSLRPLKIATDLRALPDGMGCHWLLAPLFDPRLANAQPDRPYRRNLHSYFRVAEQLFSLATLEEADIALIPCDWSVYQGGYSWLKSPNRAAIRRAQTLAAAARQEDKPVMVIFSGERSHEHVPLPGAWIMRLSMYRSRARERDISIPQVFYPDILKETGLAQPVYRRWNAKPTVGFCGFARPRRRRDYLREIGFQAFHIAREKHLGVSQFRGVELRKQAMEILARSHQIQTQFIARHESVFFGKKGDRAVHAAVRRDFLDNIMECDYQLSLRGSANYSRRPWEALCAGRPPLFVDTDCVMPYGNEIDWSSIMVIVDEADLDRLPEAVADYHSTMDDNSYRDLQARCRDVWEQCLSPEGFADWLRRFWLNRITGCMESPLVCPAASHYRDVC